MQKLLIISLLSIHLFGNTEFNQFLQIPCLLVHYGHHIQNGDNIGFLDFVSEHYGAGDNDPSDNQEEKSLPFLGLHSHSFSTAVIPAMEPLALFISVSPLQKTKTRFISYRLSVGFFGTLFKPPQSIA